MNRGVNGDDFCPTFLSSALASTSWEPKLEAFQALHASGDMFGQGNHNLDVLLILYEKHASKLGLTRDKLVPMFWSAGLIFHPKIIQLSAMFAKSHNLTNLNKEFKMFSEPVRGVFVSKSILADASQVFKHFAQGQVYTGIKLKVYKQPKHGLVMTSFQQFNPHYCGYQQLPWMVNVDGVPVYSQSGNGSVSLQVFVRTLQKYYTVFQESSTNTHNPAVTQDNDILLVSYLTHNLSGAHINMVWSLIFRSVRKRLSTDVHFFWPAKYFDESMEVIYEHEHTNDIEQLQAQVHEVPIKEEENCIPPDNNEEGVLAEVAEEYTPIEDNDICDQEDDTFNENNIIRSEEFEPIVQEEMPENELPGESQVDKEFVKKEKSKPRRKTIFGRQLKGVSDVVTQVVKGSGLLSAANRIITPAATTLRIFNSKKPVLRNRNTDPRQEKWKWLVGKRGTCYVAMLSTKVLTEDNDLRRPFGISGENQYLQTLTTTANQVSFIVVVGTTEQYSSLANFVELKLKRIEISESIVSNSHYCIVVRDHSGTEKGLSYFRNAMNPL
jgi:hypothetical protein